MYCLCDNNGTCLACLIRNKIANNPGKDKRNLIMEYYGIIGWEFYNENMI